MKNGLSIFFVSFIVVANFYIFYTTQNKIEIYQKYPPFRLVDFTQSYLVSFDSKLSNLVDKNIFTTWRKLQKNPLQTDFELELEISHFRKNNLYIPKTFETLEIYFCESIKLPLRIEVFLREAIDMDKELRLPREKIILTKTILYTNSLKEIIRLDFYPQITDIYPKNVYIIGLRGKWLAADFNPNYQPCIAEISLN